jgi:SAM-dependent methyltransferase
MLNIKERKAVWEVKHAEKDKAALSGCTYDETVDFLQVRDLVTPTAKVLEIGVGLGYVTKELSKLCVVSALDISTLALSNVSEYCESIYLVDQISTLPVDYFDLIIVHNVIQHIPTPLLREELRYAIQSLKVTGVLAIEFVSSIGVTDNGDIETVNGIGSYSRTPSFMISLIGELGGVCTMVVNNKCDIGRITGCHVFHIRKA